MTYANRLSQVGTLTYVCTLATVLEVRVPQSLLLLL
jgi:hypothetical protein